MLNYNHLFYFYVVATEKSLTSAARRLHISQPALSSQIRSLEAQLNRPLFIRSAGSRLQLTRDGKKALTYCQRIFALAEELTQQLKSNEVDCLTIGVANGIERPFAVGLIKELLARQPRTPRLEMIAGSHLQLSQKLKRGKLDVLLAEERIKQSELLADIDIPVVLAVSAKRLGTAPSQRISVAELIAALAKNEVGILAPTREHSLRKSFDLFFSQQKHSLPVVFETNMMASLVRAVHDGLGAALLPLSYLGRDRRRLILAGLPGGIFHQPLKLLTTPHTLPPHLKQMIRSAFRDFTAESNSSV